MDDLFRSPAPHPGATPPHEAAVFGFRTALVVIAALTAAVAVRHAWLPGLPIVASAALVATVALPWLLRAGRRRFGPTGEIVASGALIAQGPVLLALALYGLGYPPVLVRWAAQGDPAGVPARVVVQAALALGVAGGLGAVAASRLRVAPAVSRAASRGAAAALAAATLLVGAGAARSALVPDIEAYIRALPVLGAIGPAPESFPAMKHVASSWHDAILLKSERGDATARVKVQCIVDTCDLWLMGASGTQLPRLTLRMSEELRLVFRHDAGARVWIMDGAGPRRAFHEESMEPAVLRAGLLLGPLALGRFPLACAAAGAAIAALFLLRFRTRARRVRELEAMRQGTLDEDGWVHFDDGSPDARVDADAQLAPGPALARPIASHGDAGAYRHGPLPLAGMIQGEKRALLRAAAGSASGALAASIAASAMSISPLLAAALAGLVI
ncbi:putative membrane protein [Sorangium cellulosum So ce56]|uniref:Membrane protein n=1 Tax=Sorangium cellulosum (strain So ce56) TaxID=448385 RepID=A9G2X6_SORC5|nr:hypothetical protein [Sorangium cellulosum]CAN95698.1 putative membrane protein [Sorangium cellulosum So ce56]